MMRHRGHAITIGEDGVARYSDGVAVAEAWKMRGCGFCKRADTTEGHDACLGTLPGVRNACCGHGQEQEAYVQFGDEKVLLGEMRGALAVAYFLAAMTELNTQLLETV